MADVCKYPPLSSSYILLTLRSEDLKVWRVGPDICVQYDEAFVSDGITLTGTFGRGHCFEEACDDYLSKIRGKTLVFEGYHHKTKKEVTILG